jgi:hypothetical protein
MNGGFPGTILIKATFVVGAAKHKGLKEHQQRREKIFLIKFFNNGQVIIEECVYGQFDYRFSRELYGGRYGYLPNNKNRNSISSNFK